MSRPVLPSKVSRPAEAPPPPGQERPAPGASAGHGGGGRHQGLRMLAVPAVSLIVYFAVRPTVGSDTAGLAVAGAVPTAYTVVALMLRRRVDLWAAATSVAYALGCAISLLAGGNSLPLKLHEAAVTFLLGVVLLGAVLVRRPLPVGRVLKVPCADRAVDAALSVLTGCFLVVHALLHLTLALTLSTAAYLTAGRAVSWATLAVGAVCLYSYLRRLRRDQAGRDDAPATT